MAKRKQIVIDLDENMTVHAKAYLPKSFDKAIKAYQAMMIQQTGKNVTYSEAMRQLMIAGLMPAFELWTKDMELVVKKGDQSV